MESIPKDRILQFNPDTMVVTRKLYNLDKPKQIDEAVDLLDDWVKKQTHFIKKNFSREYLERTIILDKGSVERAKIQLDKLFTFKTLLPNFFKTFGSSNDFKEVNNIFIQALLPRLTNDNYRVYACKLIRNGITAKIFFNAFEVFLLLCEYIRSHDYCCGIVGVLDYRDMNIFELVSQVDVTEMGQLITILTEGYQMRISGIHVLTTSKAIDIFVKILKQLLPKKIGDRISVHNSLESLYNYIPKENLPTEFGGDEKSLKMLCSEWINVINSEENIEILKEMNQARTDEALRPTAKFNEEYMGTAGSFRTLCVD